MSLIEGPDNISVAGIGRMGQGIAISFAYAGFPVSLIDTEQREAEAFQTLVSRCREDIQAELDSLRNNGLLTQGQDTQIQDRIDFVAHSNAPTALSKASFIFEAVLEVLEVKQSTYNWLSEFAPPEAIIASTTSTMLADTLADFVSNPARFTNAHWLNPAYLMPLVEVSPSNKTSEETVNQLKQLLEQIGKVPVVCAASPGFIVSRLQALVLNEAARLAEEGVATPEDIDKAVKVGFGIRYATLGPLEFIDWGGGDILYNASNYLANNIDTARFTPPKIVEQNMETNRNGLRDGEGFYNYKNIDITAYRNEKLSTFIGLLKHLDLTPKAEIPFRNKEG